MTPTNVKQPFAGKQWSPPISWLCFWFCVYLIDLLIIPVSNWLSDLPGSSYADIWVLVGFGCMSGQVCSIAVVGGLCGRSWLTGYLTAVGLLVIGIGCLLGGDMIYAEVSASTSNQDWSSVLVVMLVLPLFALAISCPLLLMRILFGWQLGRTNRSAEPQPQAGMEDLFFITMLTAAAFVLATSAREVGEVAAASFWMPVAIACLVMAVASTLAVLPAVWIAFGFESASQRLGWLIGLSVLAITIGCLSMVVVDHWISVASNKPEIVVHAAGWIISACLTTLWGLYALRASQYRWRAYGDSRPIPEEQTASVVDVSWLPESPTRRRGHRWIAAGVFAAALLLNLGIAGMLRSRDARDYRLQQMDRELASRGGSLEIGDLKQVYALELGEGATQDDLRAGLKHRRLVRLSLAGGEFTDEDMPMLEGFDRLRELDLSDTDVTDQGLDSLAKLPYLQELSLARTAVTLPGVLRLLSASEVARLDLGGLAIGDLQLEQLVDWLEHNRPNHGLFHLGLSGSRITNPGLAHLNRLTSLHSIDLSDCVIDERGLVQLTSLGLNDLILDGTGISNSGLKQLLPQLNASQLSLSRTALSDAALPTLALATTLKAMRLATSNITEEGLADYRLQNMTKLGLNAPAYSGHCFKNWQPTGLIVLDMSQSGVDDEGVKYISRLPALGQLDLAHTQITDASLPYLAKCQAVQIDLSGTRVTAAGLVRANLNDKVLYVELDQFTIKQLKQISATTELYAGRRMQHW